jgi:hypothetical protein
MPSLGDCQTIVWHPRVTNYEMVLKQQYNGHPLMWVQSPLAMFVAHNVLLHATNVPLN